MPTGLYFSGDQGNHGSAVVYGDYVDIGRAREFRDVLLNSDAEWTVEFKLGTRQESSVETILAEAMHARIVSLHIGYSVPWPILRLSSTKTIATTLTDVTISDVTFTQGYQMMFIQWLGKLSNLHQLSLTNIESPNIGDVNLVNLAIGAVHPKPRHLILMGEYTSFNSFGFSKDKIILSPGHEWAGLESLLIEGYSFGTIPDVSGFTNLQALSLKQTRQSIYAPTDEFPGLLHLLRSPSCCLSELEVFVNTPDDSILCDLALAIQEYGRLKRLSVEGNLMKHQKPEILAGFLGLHMLDELKISIPMVWLHPMCLALILSAQATCFGQTQFDNTINCFIFTRQKFGNNLHNFPFGLWAMVFERLSAIYYKPFNITNPIVNATFFLLRNGQIL